MDAAPATTAGEPGLVSVVIPTHNRRQCLERCLASLIEQTHPRYEIIVVDDCSADGTADLLRRFGSEHPDAAFRFLTNDANVGANASRNRGIRAARGELVAFTDSDCIVDRNWLEHLVKPFTCPDVAAVTGRIENLPRPNIYELTYRGTNRVVASRYVNRLVGCNMCIRRDLLLKYPLDEDLKYGCDEEGIYLRLRAIGFQQQYVPNALVHHNHRFTAGSLFRQARIGGAGAAWLVYKYHLSPRLDLLPLGLAYLTLPLTLVHRTLVLLPVLLFAAAAAAYLYNDLCRKAKTLGETAKTFPILLVYYHLRLYGYVVQTLRLRLTHHNLTRVRLERMGRGEAANPPIDHADEVGNEQRS